MRSNALSSAYGTNTTGSKENLLYINTEKVRSWEGATRLQLPFALSSSLVANLSGVLTEKDFSMEDKGKVLKDSHLVNPPKSAMPLFLQSFVVLRVPSCQPRRVNLPHSPSDSIRRPAGALRSPFSVFRSPGRQRRPPCVFMHAGKKSSLMSGRMPLDSAML